MKNQRIMKRLSIVLLAVFMVALIYSFKQSGHDVMKQGEENAPSGGDKAVAVISPASGSNVQGKATFREVGDEVKVKLHLKNLEPGKHAFHLHNKGDCSASDATSAGGHWNPTNEEHGKRGQGEFHKGDIANVVANSNGKVDFTMKVDGWNVGGTKKSNILGQAVIIHAGADDFTSQPSGAAGARVACGVIQDAS